MKVAVLILAVAIVGAFAQDVTTPATGMPPFVCTSSNSFVCTFQKIAHQVKYHAGKLGGKLKDVGSSVLGAALDQGGQLLANAGQAVVGTVLEHLNKEGLMGKRQADLNGLSLENNEQLLVSREVLVSRAVVMNELKEHLSKGFDKLKQIKANLHAAFKKAVEKLTGTIADQSVLKGVDEDADKKIDAVVDEFNKDNKKGFLDMAKTIAEKLRDIYAAGMAKLKAKYGKKDETRAIVGWNSLADAWSTAKGHLSNLAGSLSDTFKPHLDNLKSGIAALGAKAKEHAGNLVDAAKGSFTDLKDKLSGHIDTLKGHAASLGSHAVNAVNALKEAVTNIAQQAVSNTKDTIADAVKTGADAAGVAIGHLTDP